MSSYIWNRFKNINSRIYFVVIALFIGLLLAIFTGLFGLPSHLNLILVKSINDIPTSDYAQTLTSIADDRVATAHKDKNIRVHNFSGENVFEVEPIYATHCLKLSDDGHHLAVHAYDGIKVYNVDTHQLERDYRNLTCPMTLSPDGKRLAVIKGLQIMILDKDQQQLLDKIDKLSKEDRLIFSPDNNLLVLSQQRFATDVWRISDGVKLYRINNNQFDDGIEFSRDSRFFTVLKICKYPGCNSGYEYELQLRQADTGEIIRAFNDNFGILASSFSPDGSKLALSSQGNIIVWDIAGNSIWGEIKPNFFQFGFKFRPGEAAISPNNRYIVFRNKETLQLRRIGDDKRLATIHSYFGTKKFKFSSDGKYFVLMDYNQQVTFYQISE